MSRILLTGASGFVGGAVLNRLVADGHSVRAAVRRPFEGRAETFAVGDIGPRTDWGRALDGIEIVVHLAARAHMTSDRSADPLSAFRAVNTEGTVGLARAAVCAGVRRFLFMSSIKAAAETSGAAALTEAMAAVPSTPYGVSKREAELGLAEEAGRRMEYVVLRPPLVYGPGVGANFRALIRLVERGAPLPLAAVRNRRSLIANANLADAVAVALSAATVADGVYYVTDGPPVSTPALVRAIAAALGRPALMFPAPPGLLRLGGAVLGRRQAAESLVDSLVADDDLFRRLTGWRPPLTMEEALAQTVGVGRGA